MDDLLKTSTFNKAIIPNNKTLIIGLSGGPDSVYLLHKLVDLRDSLQLTLIAVHLDHEWRPSSADDALFCKQLCEKLAVRFITERSSTLEKKFSFNGSKESLARDMRRYLFEKVLNENNADAIVLAHHLDDQQETFFINLIRGTSLTGLCGMKAQSEYYVRPMLSMTKKKFLIILKKNRFPFASIQQIQITLFYATEYALRYFLHFLQLMKELKITLHEPWPN